MPSIAFSISAWDAPTQIGFSRTWPSINSRKSWVSWLILPIGSGRRVYSLVNLSEGGVIELVAGFDDKINQFEVPTHFFVSKFRGRASGFFHLSKNFEKLNFSVSSPSGSSGNVVVDDCVLISLTSSSVRALTGVLLSTATPLPSSCLSPSSSCSVILSTLSTSNALTKSYRRQTRFSTKIPPQAGSPSTRPRIPSSSP